MKEKYISILSKIITFCKSYVELCIWLLVFAVGIRFFEALLLYRINHDFTSSMIWNLTGLCYDISLYLRLSVWILLIYVPICFFNEKITRVVFRILQSLMLFLSIICIIFFTTSGFLLDKVLFTYSLKEILSIIQSSSKSPFWVYMVIVVLPALFFYLSGKRIKIHRTSLLVFAILLLSSFFIFNNLTPYKEQYHVKVNKEYFFLKSIFMKNSDFKENDESITKAVIEFRRYFHELRFAEPEFPFLHQSVNKDVLSPFFDLKPKPPNFVFIIVEGLSYDILTSEVQMMPFLDSLSKKSLFWENCLSVSSRTFGVFPALFGAMPLGEKGFMDQCPNNPEYHSLLRILHQNNYTNHFFYGGWIDFDNMGQFFDKNNTTYLRKKDWDEEIIKKKIGASLGYEDHLTYLQAHLTLNQITASPRMDIYLSLSTHDPFEYPKSSQYQNIVKNNTLNCSSLSEKQRKKILAWPKVYGSFAYSDWAIQQLIESYRKRDDFDNTIFMITGDHNVSAKQFGGASNYHVPLIIYSSMLKTSRNMKGIVSHRDITPTVLSLLQNNYEINTPKEVTWLNTALDTSMTFHANTFAPLQIIDHTISGMLYKNYLICEGILEEFSGGSFQKVNNPEVMKQMERLQSLYQSLDFYILNNDALIRSDYAHKTKSAKAIFHIEDTISQNSYYAKRSGLPVVEGPLGHNTTLYFDGTDSYPFNILNFEVSDALKKFRIDIEFQIYIKNSGEECLDVITDLSDVSYKIEYLTVDKHNRWFTYKNTLLYKKELWEHLENTCRLKIYLYNPNHLEGYIDDIKVKVIVM